MKLLRHPLKSGEQSQIGHAYKLDAPTPPHPSLIQSIRILRHRGRKSPAWKRLPEIVSVVLGARGKAVDWSFLSSCGQLRHLTRAFDSETDSAAGIWRKDREMPDQELGINYRFVQVRSACAVNYFNGAVEVMLQYDWKSLHDKQTAAENWMKQWQIEFLGAFKSNFLKNTGTNSKFEEEKLKNKNPSS